MKANKITAVLLAVMLLSGASSIAADAEWYKTSSGKYYYTDSSGKKVTGWQTIDGNKYYFGSDGCMWTGWLKLGGDYYYLGTDGKAVIGKTIEIDGVSYTFGNDGKFAPSSKKYADGWHKDNSGKYFYTKNDKKLSGLQNIDGSTYYFGSGGIMHTGWKTIGSDYYYFKADGRMAKNTSLVIGGKTYSFAADGKYYAPKNTVSESSASYVLNTHTKKFHRPDCSEVDRIKDKNKEYTDESRSDIISQGYSPCKKCNP